MIVMSLYRFVHGLLHCSITVYDDSVRHIVVFLDRLVGHVDSLVGVDSEPSDEDDD